MSNLHIITTRKMCTLGASTLSHDCSVLHQCSPSSNPIIFKLSSTWSIYIRPPNLFIVVDFCNCYFLFWLSFFRHSSASFKPTSMSGIWWNVQCLHYTPIQFSYISYFTEIVWQSFDPCRTSSICFCRYLFPFLLVTIF